MKSTSPYRKTYRVFRYSADELRRCRGGVLVPLTRGKSALIDEEDAERVCEYLWTASPNLRTWRVTAIMRRENGKQVALALSRFILGDRPGKIVDHRNGNSLDNRRKNLRHATTQQNTHNRARSIRNLSGYKGVSKHPRSERWTAKIAHNGRNIYIGSYLSSEDAARAYDAKARELFGQFARCNFPGKESNE